MRVNAIRPWRTAPLGNGRKAEAKEDVSITFSFISWPSFSYQSFLLFLSSVRDIAFAMLSLRLAFVLCTCVTRIDGTLLSRFKILTSGDLQILLFMLGSLLSYPSRVKSNVPRFHRTCFLVDLHVFR